MPDVVGKRYVDMQGAFGGAMKKVRAELGLKSFGVQRFDLPPGFGGYPEHDHAESGQEELYVTLRGSGRLDVEGTDPIELDPDIAVRVGPEARRKVHAGPEGLSLLVVGGTPGAVYDPPPGTELS